MEKLQGGEQHLSSLLQGRLVTDAGWEPKHGVSAGRSTPCSAGRPFPVLSRQCENPRRLQEDLAFPVTPRKLANGKWSIIITSIGYRLRKRVFPLHHDHLFDAELYRPDEH